MLENSTLNECQRGRQLQLLCFNALVPGCCGNVPSLTELKYREPTLPKGYIVDVFHLLYS